jgi:mRNA interferase MazF
MSRFLPGDVVLVPVSIHDKGDVKVRPAVIVSSGECGELSACPVSSKPSTDSPCIPLSIDDFASGGLDLFTDSYVLTSRVLVIRSSDVIGKRGRLIPESFSEIRALAVIEQKKEKKVWRR